MTATATAPAGITGVVAVIEVADVTLKAAGIPPNVTSVAAVRFVPVMTTAVPPVAGPVTGDSEATVGALTVVTVMTEVAAEVDSEIFTVETAAVLY